MEGCVFLIILSWHRYPDWRLTAGCDSAPLVGGGKRKRRQAARDIRHPRPLCSSK